MNGKQEQGIPLGSGKVFPVAQSVIEVEPFSIPNHWARIIGLGWLSSYFCIYNFDRNAIGTFATISVRRKVRLFISNHPCKRRTVFQLHGPMMDYNMTREVDNSWRINKQQGLAMLSERARLLMALMELKQE